MTPHSGYQKTTPRRKPEDLRTDSQKYKQQVTAQAMKERAQDDGKAARAPDTNQKWSITVTKGAWVCELKQKKKKKKEWFYK